MTRRSGSFITETPSLTSVNSGSGIWPITEASQNIGNSRWPYYFPPASYTINNSLRFRSSASAYFNRTFGSGNRKTWTFSVWVKRGKLGDYYSIFSQGTGTLSNGYGSLRFNSDDTLFFFGSPDNAVNSVTWTTSGVFRDTSAWYHIVAVLDTTQSTSSNRFKLWVNGVLQAGSFGTTPTQNADIELNRASTHLIAAANAGGFGQYNDCYLADINFIDGQALTPSSFGETSTTTGVWSPKQYTGTYGTNGFYLKFNNTASTTTLGYDSSGNGNNWTTNNISLTAGSTYDAMLDVPTPVSATVGNYAVLNPLQTGSYVTQSNSNLTTTGNTATDSGIVLASISNLTSGKWYWEYTQGTLGSETCGVVTQNMAGINLNQGETITSSYGVGVRANGNVYGAEKTVANITSWTTGDVIGLALDCDNGAIYWSKNGTWLNSGVPTSGSSKTGAVGVWTPSSTKVITPSFGAYNGGSVSVTFGQRPFAYTPPTGFKALNTYNLSEPTILKGNQNFDATTYTGTGSSQSIINSGTFRPDFIWIKSRSNARDHRNMDSVRGINNVLTPNSTAAEYAGSALSSIDNIGFTLNTTDNQNVSAETYVAWQWKAGGTAVTNTSGSISSQVSANPTNGFSVVTYTGTGANATVGHGLGVAPAFIIVSARNTTHDWCAYHQSIGNTSALFPNLTSGASASIYYWNNTSPSSSVFSIGIAGGVNNSSSTTYVAYCFAAIAGYSAFGSYTGNGSSDGVFIHLGFKPRFILTKCTSTTSDWIILDTARDTYNVSGLCLEANLSVAESTNGGAYSSQTDILSNGFKIRNSGSGANGSGQTYIYAAFAENPFKYSLAR